MKQILLSAVLLFAAMYSNGQSHKAITLTSDNVNLQNGKIKEHTASGTKVKLPKTGTDQSWDYSGLTGGSVIKYAYLKNKNKAFSKTAVVDTNFWEQFDSTAGDTFLTNIVYDEDNKGMFLAGYNPPRNGYSLFTGYIQDSLVIENQASLPTSRVNLLKFPCTSGDSWSSNYKVTTHFHMTLIELGWVNIECTEVTYTTVTDEVVGWGDLKIPTLKKEDCHNEFDALLIKQSTVTTDSLFLGVTPEFAYGYPNTMAQAALYGLTAPDPYGLFPAFNVTEGMPTVVDNREMFYVENAYRPALTFEFGSDKTCSKLLRAVYNMDITGDDNDCDAAETVNNPFGYSNGNTAGNTGNGLIGNANASLSLNTSGLSVYPNPVGDNGAMNLKFVKNSAAVWTVNITNMMGQTVGTMTVSATGNLNIPMAANGTLKGGLYVVNIIDENGKQVGLSKVNVAGAAY